MRTALTIGLLLLTAGAVGAAGPASPPGGANASVDALAGLNGQAFDLAFMRAMIPVDEEAVEMAMTATLYADHPDLLHWNQVVVERKNEQVRKMLAWLQEAGANPGERRAGVATASVKKLRSLRGSAIERTFLGLMATQLDQTAAFSRLASTKAQRSELRDFAKDSLRADMQDSTTLRAWMKRWF